MQEDSPLKILNISDILPNRFQPRVKFDNEKLVQLAKSIDRFGVIEPIVVRPIGTKYEVIAGERRFKASKLVSKSTIPAIVLNLTDKESEEIALLENVQRQSLSPIEEAAQYKRILDNGYISREELAKKLGKSESSILGKIRLLSLSDEVQSYLLNNKISERHARSLLKIKNIDVQDEFLHRIVNERLTVKATDREIKEYLRESSSDTELLFDDERGIDKMDIDKIMREAKDINEPTTEEKPTVDLMANTNPMVQSEQSNVDLANSTVQDTSNEVSIPIISTEPSKFVNTNINTSIIDNEQNSDNKNLNNSNSDVTFDSMFSSPMNSLLQPEPLSNNNQSLNNGNAELNSNVGSLNGDNDISSDNLNNSFESSLNNGNDVLLNNDNKSNLLNDFDISNEGNLSLNEEPQAVSSDKILTTSNDSSAESNLLNSIGESVNTTDESILPNNLQIKKMDSLDGETDNSKELSNVSIDSKVKKDISDIVADAFRKYSDMPETPLNSKLKSVPDVDISEKSDNINNTLLNNQSDFNQVLEKEENKYTQEVANDTHKFASIVKMLRDCADNIENSGYMINVDEMDLDNEYKVIFTIKKD